MDTEHADPTGRREAPDRHLGDVDLTTWRTKAGRVGADRWTELGHRWGALPLLVVTLVIGMGVAVLGTWAASGVYDAVREGDDVAVLDRPVLDWMLTLRSPAADTLVTWWTDIAGTIGMPIVALGFLVGFTVQRRAWTPLVLLVAASGGSLLMTIAGKDLIGRARPPLSDAVPPYEHSPSFPSGHTLNATVIVGTIVYLLLLRQSSTVARVWTIAVGTAFVLSVGVSRVFLGHHWLTDVLAAWALGLAWLALVVTAHRLYLTALRRGARPTQGRGRRAPDGRPHDGPGPQGAAPNGPVGPAPDGHDDPVGPAPDGPGPGSRGRPPYGPVSHDR